MGDPQRILLANGGDLQRIARGMQNGTIDPTIGALAAMLKKNMEADAQKAPTQTVVQQLFNASAPGGAPPMGGMGAPPMGDMGPPMGAPPMGGMGAPPMGGMGAPPMDGMGPPMGAPPMGDMPPGAPPMGMADGGLAALPISDYMFDEPDNGGYAGGGIVAFADAGLTSQPTGGAGDYEQILRDNMAYYRDPQNYMRDIDAAYQPKREYAERANQFNKDLLSEAGQKKRRGEDINSFITRFGFELASTPGSLLSAAGKAGAKTLPGLQEATKERRAEVRDSLKQLAADENMTNAERRAFVIEGMKGRGDAGKIAEGFAQRAASKELAQMQETGALRRANIAADASRFGDTTRANTQISFYEKDAAKRLGDVKAAAIKQLDALRVRPDNDVGKAHNAYKMAVQSRNPQAIKDTLAAINMAERAYVESQVGLLSDIEPPSTGAGGTGNPYGAPPPGAVRLMK